MFCTLATTLAAAAAPALAQGTALTYQGELQSSGLPVNSAADFEFSLFTALTGGTQVGPTITRSGVSVSSGLFTTAVDFGVNAYTSNQTLFLQVAVRNPAGSGSFVTLGSRQLLTPTPFSLATRGINVNAAGDIALLTGANRTITVPNTPANTSGTNLSISAGNGSTFNFATEGGDLVLEAGRAFNVDQSFIRPGDVFIRTGGNASSSGTAPNGGDIIMQTGGAFGAINERMRLTQNGNVGIGTTTPRTLLDVVRPVSVNNTPAAILQVSVCGAPCSQPNYTEALRLLNVGIANGAPNGIGQVGIGMSSAAAATATSTADVWLGTGFLADAGDQSNDFILATKTSPTALTNRLRVNGDTGNVGIGTDAPAARVHNVGTTRLDDALQFGVQNFTGTTGSNAKLYRFGAGGNFTNLYLDMTASAPGSSFIFQANGNDRFSFDLSDGTALKTGGGSWSVLSDERTKTDIQPMTGTLDRLLQLKGHAYTYKPEFVENGRALPGMQVGLVAQEVETVFPDWVSTGADGLKQVTERSTTALMVEALRDLRTEKDAEIASLKARLEKLEAMLTTASK
jgi:hypothetical protein